MKPYARYAIRLGTGLTALVLLVRCTVEGRDYAELNIGSPGGGAGSGSAGSGAGNGGDGTGGAPDAGNSDAGLPNDAGQASGASGGSGGDTAGAGGGTGGSGGAGGTGGSGGTSGSGGAGGSGGSGGAGGSGGGGGCGPTEVCVPSVPTGWTGPIVVSTAVGVTDCPGPYATPLGNVNAGLIAPAASCGCSCFVGDVDCFIQSGNTGDPFEPPPFDDCVSPPTDNDCLSAQLSTSCTTSVSQTITPVTWTTTRLTCGGATSSDSCSGGGACFPSGAAFGPVCISQNADALCPSAFPNRNLFFRSVTDTRSCTACGCFTQGQSCEIEIDVCSVGCGPVTLSTDEGTEACLSSDEGDCVGLVSTTIEPGTCSTTGGAAQGSAVPSSPVTLCCL